MIHIPILRHGVPYTSLDVIRIPHHRTRETFAEMSQVNPGIIRRELRDETQADARAALARIPFDRLLEICARAADHFLNDTLPLGDERQTAGRLRPAALRDHRHAARHGSART